MSNYYVHHYRIGSLKLLAFEIIELVLAEIKVNWPIVIWVCGACYFCAGSGAGRSLWQNVAANAFDGKYVLMRDIGASIGTVVFAVLLLYMSRAVNFGGARRTILGNYSAAIIISGFYFYISVEPVLYLDIGHSLILFTSIYFLISIIFYFAPNLSPPAHVTWFLAATLCLLMKKYLGASAFLFVIPETLRFFCVIFHDNVGPLQKCTFQRQQSSDQIRYRFAGIAGLALLSATLATLFGAIIFLCTSLSSFSIEKSDFHKELLLLSLAFYANLCFALISVLRMTHDLEADIHFRVWWLRYLLGAIAWPSLIFLGIGFIGANFHLIIFPDLDYLGDYSASNEYVSRIIPFGAMLVPCFTCGLASTKFNPSFRSYARSSLLLLGVLIMCCAVISYNDYYLANQLGTLFIGFVSTAILGALVIQLSVVALRDTKKFRWTVLLFIAFSVSNRTEVLADFSGKDGNFQRTDISDYVKRKLALYPDGPFIFVVASGGGIRAAVHTATVLEALDARFCGLLSRQMIAISSVSGGSLGAMSFLSSPERKKLAPAFNLSNNCAKPARAWGAVSTDHISIKFLTQDSLPSQLGHLFTKIIFPMDLSREKSDEILPRFWEMQWAKTTGTSISEKLTKSEIFAPDAPIFIINSTSANTGGRLAYINKELRDDNFPDLLKLYPGVAGKSVADAVYDSARFPFISQPSPVPIFDIDRHAALAKIANLRQKDGLSDDEKYRIGLEIAHQYLSPQVRIADYLVDGGYFENYGADTLSHVINIAKSSGMPTSRMLLIVIHNNPLIESADMVCPSSQKIKLNVSFPSKQKEEDILIPNSYFDITPSSRRLATGLESWVPLHTFLNAQDARGNADLRGLATSFGCDNVVNATLRVTIDEAIPALTWTADRSMIEWSSRSAYSVIRNVETKPIFTRLSH